MTVWRLGIEIGCSSFIELKSRRVVAQGWPYTGNMAFLQNNKNIINWLQKLVPGDEKAQRTLRNLLARIRPGDIILGFEGNTIKGICEMPDRYIYMYRNYHKACSFTTPTSRVCDYANCLYPVNWVDWNIFEKHCVSSNIDLPIPKAGQGIEGIEECHKNANDIMAAWNAYKISVGHDPNHITPPIQDTLAKKWVNKLSTHMDALESKSLKTINCRITQNKTNHLFNVITVSKQMILYGPPGTGKTYIAKALAARLLNLDTCDADRELERNDLYWDIVQFHPSYSYEDFVGGIRPDLTRGNLGYTLNKGIFKKITDAADKNPKQPYVLIIDEINRANLPSVLGELLYALEYRGKAIKIPNFKSLIVPHNLYIIGTMNNIDKSLVSFDVALQRRFAFEYIDADLDIVNAVLHQEYSGIPAALKHVKEYLACCEGVSNKLQSELALPQERPIGHSYFIRIKDYIIQLSKDSRKKSDWKYCKGLLWDYHIAPLLEEYLGKRYMDSKKELDIIRNEFVNG